MSIGQRVRVFIGVALLVGAFLAPRLDFESLLRGSGIRFNPGPITNPAALIGVVIFLDIAIVVAYSAWQARARSLSTRIDEEGLSQSAGAASWHARWGDIRRVVCTPVRSPSGIVLATIHSNGPKRRITCGAEQAALLRGIAKSKDVPVQEHAHSIRLIAADYVPGMALIAGLIWVILSMVDTFI